MTTTNKRFLLGCTFGALLFPIIASAAFTSKDWQWKKAIQFPEADGSSQYVKVDLDQESSIYSTPTFSDLRVVRNGSIEVPFQLVTETTEEEKAFLGATIIDRAFDKGDMVFVIDVGSLGKKHNAVEIGVSNPNFRRQVSIYSSDILLDWSDPKWGWINPSSINGALVRSTDAFIYRFTDNELGFVAGNAVVYYPETSARYLRVVIHKENDKKELLSVTQANILRELRPIVKEEEMHVNANVTENSTTRTTEILVDLGGGGLSTSALTLHSSDATNFNRRATIQGSGDNTNWRSISQAYLFRVNTAYFSGTELTLRYPLAAYRYLRVLVYNDDNQPVQFSSDVLLRSPLRSVVFDQSLGGEARYELFYGNPQAVKPQYDIARYFQYIESLTLSRATLGKQEVNIAYVPKAPPSVPFLERNRNPLNGVLVLFVAVISFMMISYLKKLKHRRLND